MLNLFKPKSRGFTLIEIVIVLAIAGLIFVIVFLAVSQAQASRRDTQRKTDGNRLHAAVNQYAANNGGNLPTTNAFVSSYLTNFNDPSGTAYTVTVAAFTSGTQAANTFNYATSRKCNTPNDGYMAAAATGGTRDFAIVGPLERGGQFCIDNQ